MTSNTASSHMATSGATEPFGRVLTAMVTPFTPEGELDVDAAQTVANYLIDAGNDGLVVSGTTGESPTTTVAEDARLLKAVVEAVGDRARVVAGVGTNDTRHSVELARQADKIGASGLLVVSPYYSKPPQAGIIDHVERVVAAGGSRPTLLYDIPGRTAVQFSEDTLHRLSENPAVIGVKDAVGDLQRGAWIMHHTGLKIYSGDDKLNLAWLAVGASGVVSVVGHVAAREYVHMAAAVERGDLRTAQEINNRLLAIDRAMMTVTQGAMTAKAVLQILGVLSNRTTRLPLPEASEEETAILRDAMKASGLLAN